MKSSSVRKEWHFRKLPCSPVILKAMKVSSDSCVVVLLVGWALKNVSQKRFPIARLSTEFILTYFKSMRAPQE